MLVLQQMKSGRLVKQENRVEQVLWNGLVRDLTEKLNKAGLGVSSTH